MMDARHKSRCVIVAPLLTTITIWILVFMINPVWADSDYSITWVSIENGGSSSAGGIYSITGSIGQYDIDILQADRYVLSGGFWAGTAGCQVTLEDLAMLAEQWLGSGSADMDHSGTVNMMDFNTLAAYWLNACPAGWSLVEF